MPTASVHDVSNYFLSLVDEGAGESISNLKMQKLVYYAQGFHLALFDEPLFAEPMEAWRYGPVVPALYNVLKEHGAGVIPIPADFNAEEVFEAAQLSLLNDVYATYAQFSAWKLRDMTHAEAPWKDADARGVWPIEHDALKAFFLTQLES